MAASNLHVPGGSSADNECMLTLAHCRAMKNIRTLFCVAGKSNLRPLDSHRFGTQSCMTARTPGRPLNLAAWSRVTCDNRALALSRLSI